MINPKQKINIIWYDYHEDTGREISNIIHLQQPRRCRAVHNLYAVYRYGKRLEHEAMTAQEIDKRARERQGTKGLLWYVENGYSVKLVKNITIAA